MVSSFRNFIKTNNGILATKTKRTWKNT